MASYTPHPKKEPKLKTTNHEQPAGIWDFPDKATALVIANQVIALLCFCVYSIKAFFLAYQWSSPNHLMTSIWQCPVGIDVCSHKHLKIFMCLHSSSNTFTTLNSHNFLMKGVTYCPCFTDKGTEAQRGEVTHPGSHSC